MPTMSVNGACCLCMCGCVTLWDLWVLTWDLSFLCFIIFKTCICFNVGTTYNLWLGDWASGQLGLPSEKMVESWIDQSSVENGPIGKFHHHQWRYKPLFRLTWAFAHSCREHSTHPGAVRKQNCNEIGCSRCQFLSYFCCLWTDSLLSGTVLIMLVQHKADKQLVESYLSALPFLYSQLVGKIIAAGAGMGR